MKPEELLKYEMPLWIDNISINWMQDIVAWYYSKKVNKKIKRLNHRNWRENYLREKGLIK
jgi:hypothetical protein